MKTILIVDDSRETAEVLTLILEMNGYQVFWAAHGLEGMEKVHEVKPDLIMLDYMMPFMNGAAMCDALRQDPSHAAIKIIVQSCLTESAVNARFTGFNAFLQKPCDVEAVLQLVQDLTNE